MKVKEARKARDLLMAAGIGILLAGYLWKPLTIVGVIVAFSCLIPDFLYNKCPHCGKHLGRNEGAYCQHCGGKIE